jgi:glycosyltransferase involved in cell wall biosynthesis
LAKFLFCLPRYHTNAAPWVRILQDAGHEVAMHCVIAGATENHTGLRPLVHSPSALSVGLGGTPQSDARLFPEFLVVHRAIAAERPDVVIVRGLTRWFMRMVAISALVQGLRLVIYDQEEPHPAFSTTWVRRALCRVVGIRHFTPKVDHRPLSGIASALQIPFGRVFALPPRHPNSDREPNWPPRVLMVAKYRERKRHADLIEALGLLKDRHAFSVTFCGEVTSAADRAFCRDLQLMAERCGIGDRLTFQHNVPHDEMMGVYMEHDVFVLPSVREPAAVSPIEAAWCGCAVIMSRGSGTRSYMPPDDAFEFSDGDPVDLARAVARLLRDSRTLVEAQEQCFHAISLQASDTLILSRFEMLCSPKP